MKIALIGYGKMGKIIEEIALSRGHEIVLKVTGENAATYTDAELKAADVAIEFSRPEHAVTNMMRCFNTGVPVVVGTTGWHNQMEYVAHQCNEKQGVLFHASNFSLGVNLFFKLNKTLAQLMNAHHEYEVIMEEIHHIHKLDSPSGTGITLADDILAGLDRKTYWKDYRDSIPEIVPAEELPIHSIRTGEVPGTHSIEYKSSVDRIVITHEAFSRKGFAFGAVIAAEWLKGQPQGMFGMNDLLSK
ncbi:MAG: 4-hydroxy-tetrahydrodipicolinate reductase [Bacteroidia bacterium]